MSDSSYTIDRLTKLGIPGGTITGFAEDGSGYDHYMGLVITTAEGKRYVLWVNRDPEGNGPGWLDPQEI
jgi:hypothetical protein